MQRANNSREVKLEQLTPTSRSYHWRNLGAFICFWTLIGTAVYFYLYQYEFLMNYIAYAAGGFILIYSSYVYFTFSQNHFRQYLDHKFNVIDFKEKFEDILNLSK